MHKCTLLIQFQKHKTQEQWKFEYPFNFSGLDPNEGWLEGTDGEHRWIIKKSWKGLHVNVVKEVILLSREIDSGITNAQHVFLFV